MGGVWAAPADRKWDPFLTVFCPPDSRTGQAVHCIEVYKYEVRDGAKPLPFDSGVFAAPCCLTAALLCFQSCARPQYGKWISCLATDSDWMVGSCDWSGPADAAGR